MLHVVMYPWLAYGHMIPYIHLANQLAKRGHNVTFILPNKAKTRLQPLLLYPSLITFRTIVVPHVPPLPIDTENATDVPDLTLHTFLATAFDRTRPEFESIVTSLGNGPDVIFYDLAYWVPDVTGQLGGTTKSVCYNVVSAFSMNITKRIQGNKSSHEKSSPCTPDEPETNSQQSCYPKGKGQESRDDPLGEGLSILDRLKAMFNSQQSCYPKVKGRESRGDPLGEGLSILDRLKAMLNNCDAIAFRTCREVEGEDCDDLSKEYNKNLFLTGPVIPALDKEAELDPQWAEWLARYEVGSVVFCALGSQFSLDKAQFQELLLGFELTSLPFFLALMAPKGCATIEEAYPEGFKERVGERGVVTDKWVQQPLILAHESVGCFVNHCGFGTMWESLLSKNHIVLIPQLADQVMNANMLADKMKVGVEVGRGDGGWVSKESLCKAVVSVMDEKSEIGELVKKNHQIWRHKLGAPTFMDDYLDSFIQDIQGLVS